MKSTQSSITSKSHLQNPLQINKTSSKYTIKINNQSKPKTNVHSINQINTRGKVLQNKTVQSKKSPYNLQDYLNTSFKDYQQHNSKWTSVFIDKVLSDDNFTLDLVNFSVKSLNEKSSELFQYESFWIMLLEVLYKKTQGKKETHQLINFFNMAFEYVTEVKMIIACYFDKMSVLLGKNEVKKNDLITMLNSNAQFMINYPINEMDNKKKKKKKKIGKSKDEDEDSKLKTCEKAFELYTSKENFEFFPSENLKEQYEKKQSMLNKLTQQENQIKEIEKIKEEYLKNSIKKVSDIQEEEKINTSLDIQASTMCNASTSLDYQNTFSFKKPNENILPPHQEISHIKFHPNPIPNVIIGEDIKMADCDVIIPHYEQKKLLKVKQIMSEIDNSHYLIQNPNPIDLESLDQVTDNLSSHGQNSIGLPRSLTTPQRSRFSSLEKFPLDIVEGSIQKFNQSFSKSDHN